jgi:hypothetical protein
VPGGLEHFQTDPAKAQPLSVAQPRELVLGVRTTAEVDPGTLAVAQLEMPGDEVSVKVGQEHVPDPAAEPVGVLDVLVNITLRIDHRGDAASLISHQVRRMRQAPQVVLPEDQRRPRRSDLRGSGRSDGRYRPHAEHPKLWA